MPRGFHGGFEQQGYLPEHYWHGDQFWGIYRMALTRERWQEQKENFEAELEPMLAQSVLLLVRKATNNIHTWYVYREPWCTR